jgi:cytochrome b subunit of formate dehydrogenase
MANLSIIYTIHDLAAALFLPLLIIHIYLGLLINPETIHSIFGGYVLRSWLEEHHPDGETGVRSEI